MHFPHEARFHQGVQIRLRFSSADTHPHTGRGLDRALKAAHLRYQADIRVRLRGGLPFSLSLLRCFSGRGNELRLLEQFAQGNRVVPSFPVHADHPEKRC